MTGPVAHPPDPEATARQSLADLSAAFHSRDLAALLATFTERSASPTYAGSEAGEVATGRDELAVLLGGLLTRPERYRFTFPQVVARRVGPAVYVVADGTGHEADDGTDGTDRTDRTHGSDRSETVFPYRISGVLVREDRRWRWAFVSGSEPTHDHRDAEDPPVIPGTSPAS